ncbi:MAG: copper chaperone PCu(A)C [Methylophilus sp.]
MQSYFKKGLVIVNMICFTALAHAEVKITNAWVKPTVPGQPVAGAYMALISDKDVDIVATQSPVAGKAEIHSMSMEGNIMRMKKLDRLQLKAGKAVELKPGGFHLMLIELNHQIKEGEIVPISLVTQDVSGKKATITIKAITTAPKMSESPSDMHMHH